MSTSEKQLRILIRKILIKENKFSQLSQYAKNTEMDIYDDLMDPKNTALRDEVFRLYIF